MPDEDTAPSPESSDAPEPSDAQAPAPADAESVEQALDDAKTTADETVETVQNASGEPGDFVMPEFDDAASGMSPASIELLSDVNLNVKNELGRTRLLVEDVLKLGEGAVVELDKLAGDPVDIFVNDRLVARGVVLVLNDNFCVRVSEILDTTGDAAREATGAA